MNKIGTGLILVLLAAGVASADERTETLKQGWDGSAWVTQGKTSCSYPSDNQKITTNYIWNGGSFVPVNRITVTTDNSGSPVETVTEMYLSSAWVEISRAAHTNTYENGRIAVCETDNSSCLTKEIYSYENDKLKTVLGQVFDGSWTDTDRRTCYYNGSSIDYMVTEEHDGTSWTNMTRSVFSYLSGSVSSIETFDWNTDWQNSMIHYFYYNSSGTVDYEHFQYWNGSGYTDGDKWLHSYGTTDVPGTDGPVHPETCTLANYPNPFNPETSIVFQLPCSDYISLKIYDTRGRLVRTLAPESRWSAGSHTLRWDGRGSSGQALPSGIYIYTLSGSTYTRREQCLLLK